jgi:hypothetical protein
MGSQRRHPNPTLLIDQSALPKVPDGRQIRRPIPGIPKQPCRRVLQKSLPGGKPVPVTVYYRSFLDFMCRLRLPRRDKVASAADNIL